MTQFKNLKAPKSGAPIQVKDGKIEVPDEPIIAYIEGDGIAVDITPAMLKVVNAAVERAYGGKRRIEWFEIFAGGKANERYGEWLPKDTLKAIETYAVAIKGPLTTPVGGGHRSLNVSLRQLLNLYACVRPRPVVPGGPEPGPPP